MMCEDQNEKPKRCGKYSFRLVGKPKKYFKETTLVDFKPNQKTKKISKISILPTFNKDGKFYTPAFIIPSLPLQQDEVLIQEHQKRVKENTQQISQLYVPKPRSRQKYCGVCRQYYEEYLNHIEGLKHTQKLKNSTFQKYLIEESEKFKQIPLETQSEMQKGHSTQISNDTIFPQNQYIFAIEAYLDFN